MIASTVSSNMLSAVARQEGFTFEETLPGFKWMGHRGQQLKVGVNERLLHGVIKRAWSLIFLVLGFAHRRFGSIFDVLE